LSAVVGRAEIVACDWDVALAEETGRGIRMWGAVTVGRGEGALVARGVGEGALSGGADAAGLVAERAARGTMTRGVGVGPPEEGAAEVAIDAASWEDRSRGDLGLAVQAVRTTMARTSVTAAAMAMDSTIGWRSAAARRRAGADQDGSLISVGAPIGPVPAFRWVGRGARSGWDDSGSGAGPTARWPPSGERTDPGTDCSTGRRGEG